MHYVYSGMAKGISQAEVTSNSNRQAGKADKAGS